MKNKSLESSVTSKDYKNRIEEYNGRHFDDILNEFPDCPLHIFSYGKSRYPLSMDIQTPQGKMCLFFKDSYSIETCFYPCKSS